jgi:hypothetical protein
VLLRAVTYHLSLLLQSKVEPWDKPCELEHFRVVFVPVAVYRLSRSSAYSGQKGRIYFAVCRDLSHVHIATFVRDVAIRKEGIESDLFCSN